MIRRRVTRALVAAAVLAGLSTGAEARCSSANDQSAFDVGALKSLMSVLAVACGDDDDYNRFVERDRAELIAEDAVVNAWFKRTFGRTAQPHYDSYITLLANEQSIKGQHEGSDFCPRLKPIFAEAALVPIKLLPQYAAAKDLLPKDMACEVEPVAAPRGTARRGAATTRPAARPKK